MAQGWASAEMMALSLWTSLSTVVTVTDSSFPRCPAVMRPLEDRERGADTQKAEIRQRDSRQHGGRCLTSEKSFSITKLNHLLTPNSLPCDCVLRLEVHLLPEHFHRDPLTLWLIDNYPAQHDLWLQTQIKIQLKVKACSFRKRRFAEWMHLNPINHSHNSIGCTCHSAATVHSVSGIPLSTLPTSHLMW